MKYLSLGRKGRATMDRDLLQMPSFLEERFASLSPEEAVTGGPNEIFSPVEQSWHLADLEIDGFGTRIRRLLREVQPLLPDFDGGKFARERRYKSRSVLGGLSAFRAAREANLAMLRNLTADQWSRAGTQEGLGVVMLCDLPVMMAEHDSAHRAEIEAWSNARAGRPTRG